MAYEVTRQTPIGELVLNCPAAASVLLEHGFHCIGCGLAAYETIEEGAAAHGMDDAAIDKLVEEIKEAAKNEAEALKRATTAPVPAKTPAKEKAKKKSKSG